MPAPAFLSRVIPAACLWLAVAGVGCSRPTRRPVVAPVTGVVTYNGSPLANAAVFFVPTDPTASPWANIWSRATTNSSGEFVVTTFEKEDGSLPGSKLVKVVAQEDLKPGPDTEGETVTVTPKALIPVRYFDETTSGLKATVVAGKQNRFEFALTDENGASHQK